MTLVSRTLFGPALVQLSRIVSPEVPLRVALLNIKNEARVVGNFVRIAAALILFAGACAFPSTSQAQSAGFHNAPADATKMKNPVAGKADAAQAGANLYAKKCSLCHGDKGQGVASIPALSKDPTQSATDGAIFWFITKGAPGNGMPAWASLPAEQRWQIVTYIKSLGKGKAPPPTAKVEPDAPPGPIAGASPPTPPFTDYRFERPGTARKITPADLPQPYATKSASNGPRVVARPSDAWPKAPPGFSVQQFATGLDNPRFIITAPNGDIFVAEPDPGNIEVFRGIGSDGKAQQVETFTSKLKQPYGLAFYPPGPNPQFVYVGNEQSVVRFPYQNGDLKARGPSQKITDLPGGSGHSTRAVTFSPDGKKMFVAVGSESNVDDPNTTPAEKNRADILEFNPDGSGMRVFAYGIRNPGPGLVINPQTGELWCSVNERDGLGDNLVPDYITHVQDGGFYGWPWWYIGGNQDPRHKGKHPELKDKVIVPDVLLQPHNASLQLTFYTGSQFPAEYQGDIFASEHGSWNRSPRAGYEVIRVPLHQTGHASGEYEDFLTGFVLDNRKVWGRPVGVAVAPDGSLLVTDDGSNSIWRVSYAGK
jgi:glucose/arabinose dehydrogenase/mono/diheme cytochrome c family protein